MSNNIIIRIQENLSYPPLKKIDPNTQQVTKVYGEPADHSFSQAAIPSILASFFRLVQTDEGASVFLENGENINWIETLFGENQEEVIRHISTYSGQPGELVVWKMQAIAEETVRIVKEKLPANAGVQDVKTFFYQEKNNILTYLPPELQMGKLLDNDALDDQTHKMEGPVSGLMQKLANAFDTTKAKENIKEPFHH